MKASALDNYTVRDVLAHRGNPKLQYSIGENSTVEQALTLMLAHDIISLPVFKASSDLARPSFIDIVSLYDLRDHITHSPDLEAEVHFQLLSGRPSGKATVLQDTITNVVSSRKHASQVISADASLEELVRLFTKLGQHRVLVSDLGRPSPEHRHQRVPDGAASENENDDILGDSGDGQSSVCGLTQSDVVRFIQRHNHQLGRQLDVTAADIASAKPSPSPALPQLTIREPALSAMKKLRDTHTSALPVVDYDGRLVTEVAGTSLRYLTIDKLGLLGKPVLAYMFGLRLPVASPYVIHANFTLSQIMTGLLRMNCRRAWLVDEEERPTSVISLTDVLAQFL
ncbi:hypothetical protein GGI12_000423 [Dipsacomyces acuminosporus]|nr:hypothetical protein GGI12_000423 [Dipsacomyces acuminosporus]